ncbi:unnamed protein product [Camellia sinensis]
MYGNHAGLVEEGQHYFQLMKVYGIEPTDQHSASMVDLLGRAGKLQVAVSVINEMHTKPTESVWGALLTGCRIHGDTELAAYAADRVSELGPVSSGMHVLLSNAYAAAGRYEEAAKARKMLRDRGMKKETGLSWIEEGNRVHKFAARDRSHAKSTEIYRKLEELRDEMERAGYVADTSFVLGEVDSDEKNQAIRYHSERLAIAFGLIALPPERTLRARGRDSFLHPVLLKIRNTIETVLLWPSFDGDEVFQSSAWVIQLISVMLNAGDVAMRDSVLSYVIHQLTHDKNEVVWSAKMGNEDCTSQTLARNPLLGKFFHVSFSRRKVMMESEHRAACLQVFFSAVYHLKSIILHYTSDLLKVSEIS